MSPLLQDAALGQVSFSILGSFGAALQVVLILYPLCQHWGLPSSASSPPTPLSPLCSLLNTPPQLPDALLRRGFLQLPSLHSAAPREAGHPPDQGETPPPSPQSRAVGPSNGAAPLLLPRSSGTASHCWCSAPPCPSSPGRWVRSGAAGGGFGGFVGGHLLTPPPSFAHRNHSLRPPGGFWPL